MIICKRPIPPDDHLQEAGRSGWSGGPQGDGTEEEKKEKKKEEKEEKKFLRMGTHTHTDQSKVVQEVLVDLKSPLSIWAFAI